MFSFFHGFGHGETWIILRTLGFGRFFSGSGLVGFCLDLDGFFGSGSCWFFL